MSAKFIMKKYIHTLTLVLGVWAFVFAALHFTSVPQKQVRLKNEEVSTSSITDTVAKRRYTKMEIDYFLKNYNKPKNEIWVCYFWATWCMNCTRTHRTLSQLDQQFKASNVRLISLSMDKKKKKWSKFLDENGADWEQIYATGMSFDKRFVRDFGSITALPQCFIIYRTGEVKRVKLLNQLRDEIMKAIEQ